ncbi:MAG: SulP family inorganic anion transporter [Saprospiraceae bacterium]|nr:SulP family inorganic anion transporter [Saprospiraceae bacterium]
MEIVPKTGLKGLIENWQSDLLAAVSVSLVALPLSLGIAIASGLSPVSGMLSAIIGGIVTTFIRGSHLAINGPTAGLIAVVLASIAALDDGSGRALNYVFAAMVVAGGIQILLGFFKLGRFADLFHSTVVHGILAAIGVIILAKQIHIAMGTTSSSGHIIGTLIDAVRQLPNSNPVVAGISLVGLLLLVFHSRISYAFFHFLPAPMWVLILSIPFAYLFNFFEPHTFHAFGRTYELGPEQLIAIPDNLLDAFVYPDFSRMHTFPFWLSVVSIAMIASIESLASGKAVEKLDPYRRKTSANKDMVGIGLSTMISGALGGLPVINVIVRSTVNVHNHAKTKWSNFFHGVLLLLFIVLLAPVIQKVPLCALAILLVYTGYKLASPSVFKHVYSQGIEQMLFFSGTLILTLFTNLLVGIFGGLLLALITHMLLAKVPPRTFFQLVFKSDSELLQQGDGVYRLKISGIANFLATIKIENLLRKIPAQATATIDLSSARLVDFSILEHLYDFQRSHAYSGGKIEIAGLERHISSSRNKRALKILTDPMHRMSTRQTRLNELATASGWDFHSEPSNAIDYYESFYFFKSRPVDEQFSRISGAEGDGWEVADIAFEEGAFISTEEYKTTLGLIRLPHPIPKFAIEKKIFPLRFLNLAAHKDIDYVLYPNFSDDFIVKVEDIEAMQTFMTAELRTLIEQSETIHHLESNGEAILLFTDNLQLARVRDYPQIVEFARQMRGLIVSGSV